ncbi:hypothetical protein [Caballeronia sp. GAFFF2]|uniref:hypothetical protein n=1 Tax=Caballeronia sp. GAFFF2 TaxID=2921741 RepID=UPI002027946B|nr:hypothetical protein [Caballeronia sp. GAFFF2]
MAEPTQFMLTHKELVTVLVKEADVHSGIWQLSFNLGFGAANMGSGPEKDDLNPTAIIPILGVGIQRVDEITNLSVDAAQVNPVQR